MKNLAGNCLQRARQIVHSLVSRATAGHVSQCTHAQILRSLNHLCPSPIHLPKEQQKHLPRDATRRHQPPSQPHPRAPKTLQAPAHLKRRGYQHIDGSVPKPHTGPHTHTPNPYRIKKSRKPQSQKPSAAEKNTAHQPGGKRGGENLLGGYDESARTRSQRSSWWW